MNTDTAAKPLIVAEIDPSQFDTLTEAPAAEVVASKLRDGMVLLDPELGTPAAVIDHRNRSVRGSGEVRLFLFDLDANRYAETSISARRAVRVMAR